MITITVDGVNYVWNYKRLRGGAWGPSWIDTRPLHSAETGRRLGDMRVIKGFAFYVSGIDPGYEWRAKDAVYWQILDENKLSAFKKEVFP